ncbi:Rubrofusarin-specific efflux pump aurT [Penicillium diatomitis]|uniref:Rubrofusarin-specific efflux pump aurT n=1 Tax=Penicillium diatomitis TaxID=2819901 RepID=A0A9W9XGB1_9EURO|nr:Rubrofusarin-specific efflux pump aurT [Penicillium diatomitis]KAJ5491694.1 Rubrofusarin-specific efflux pump aurT [Penicillium diatomitis]
MSNSKPQEAYLLNEQSRPSIESKEAATDSPEDDAQYPTGMKLKVIFTSIIMAMFLVALDRTIIATAVPQIANQFNALSDISWYASAYLLTSCATQLLWGKIYTLYSTKTIFLIAILIFEVGSALCGGAPSSKAFIVGRAIAGMGSAGIFSGSSIIVAQIVPLAKRPMYVGLMGSTFGISSIVGPLMGGAFTDKVTWRWCFYINLPIGGFTMIVLFFLLRVPAPRVLQSSGWKQQLLGLDPLGTVLFLPSIICFLLALQWGGSTYAWDNGRIIALLVLSGLLMILFVLVQIQLKDTATVPSAILKQRSILSGVVFVACVGGGLISILYTLPLWFQAVRSTSAVKSGVDTIPLVLSLVIGAILSGGIITATGYYVPWMFVAAIFMSTGAGLMTTFQLDTDHAAWIGYQVLFGLGIGFGMQQSSLAAQTVLKQDQVPVGISLMFFAQSLGGAIFIAVAQALFQNYLSAKIPLIDGIDAAKVLAAGATSLSKVVPMGKLHDILLVYNEALRRSFIVTVAVSCCMVLPCLTMEWKTIKKDKKAMPNA